MATKIYKKGNAIAINDARYNQSSISYSIVNTASEKTILILINGVSDNRRIPFAEIQLENGMQAGVTFELTDTYLSTIINSVTAIVGTTTISDFGLEVAKDNVIGNSPINKWGKNPNIGTISAPEDITDIGGIYVPPTQNRTHQVKSSSVQDKGILRGSYVSTAFSQTSLIDMAATFITDGVAIGDVVINDTNQDHSIVLSIVSETQIDIEPWHHSELTNVGNSFRIAGSSGTGAIVAHIKLGYQKDGAQLTEFVILNGTANVATTNQYYRVTRMHIHGAGIDKSNSGDITLTADIDATITAKIVAGNGQTEMAFQHIPIGYTGYIVSWNSSIYRTGAASNAMAQMQIRSNLWGVDASVLEYEQAIHVGNSPQITFNPPKKFTQGTDVWVRCNDVSDNNSIITSGFDMILVKN